MANWKKLNSELDGALDSMTHEDWVIWQKKFKQKQLNHLKSKAAKELESIDVDKLAEEFAKNYSIYPTAQDDTEYGFKHGFNKAIEILKQQEQ
jgi:hypothetical protein